MSFDVLEHQAAALDAEIAADNTIPDPAIEQAEQIAAGNAKFQPMIRQGLGMVVVLASQPYPFIRDHFTPQTVDNQASVLVKLADEYALDMSAWLGQDGGRVMLWVEVVMAFGLPLMGCWAAYQQSKHTPRASGVEVPVEHPETTPAMEG